MEIKLQSLTSELSIYLNKKILDIGLKAHDKPHEQIQLLTSFYTSRIYSSKCELFLYVRQLS